MVDKRKTLFQIDHLDPMGQGVDKETSKEKVIFVKKTLPGEKGTALLYKENKRIAFAFPDQLTQVSPLRITPDCPHFATCNACHFLHTSYQNEIEFKKQSLKFIFKDLFKDIQNRIKVVEATDRFSYRNRVQLHYDKKRVILGFISVDQKTICPVPSCLIVHPLIQDEIKKLYTGNSWLELVKNDAQTGHIEIAFSNKLSIRVNKAYAHQGFSQVNFEMNLKLVNLVNQKLQSLHYDHLYDLFGGSGNLSQGQEKATLVIDSKVSSDKLLAHQNYLELNLFKNEDIKKIPHFKKSVIIIDPPRSGMKNIGQLVKHLDSEDLIYVSCNPQTLKRDIKSLDGQFRIKDLYLIDLFPSTYHFETMVHLSKL